MQKDEAYYQQLNRREKYKAQMRPYDYFKEFETLDFESLGEGDRYYLQDFGIFNTDFLEDEFTIRIRVAGGRLTATQFNHLADVVEDYDLTFVLTARGGIQLHDINVDDVKAIWKKCNEEGLSTWQSFGDNIRNIVSDVYDGIGEYAHIEVQGIIEQMQSYILKNPKYVGMLPRRVSIGISGNSASVNSFFANDIYFALAKKENIYGFNIYMGGKNNELALDMDIFLQHDEVFDFFKAFVSMFYNHGSRFSRSKTRFFYMLQSHGKEKVCELLQEEYQKEFQSAGVLQLKHVDFKEFETLNDGTFSYCYQSDFARVTPTEMREISNFSLQSSCSIRLGIDQNIYLLGLKDKKVPFSALKLSSTIVACAGNLCPYSAWSIKDKTRYLPLEKIYKHRIKIGFSGCVKGCGRHRHTDIGLIGLKTNNFGDTEGGARVFIGAEHDTGISVSRQLFAMVPFVHLYKTMELIITLYEKSTYKNFQLYAHHILNYYSEEFLALWHLLNLKTSQAITLLPCSSLMTLEDEVHLLQKTFHYEVLDGNFKKSVVTLSKALWSVEGKDPNYKPPIKRVNVR